MIFLELKSLFGIQCLEGHFELSRELLKKGINRISDNEKNINFWYNNWISNPRSSLKFCRTRNSSYIFKEEFAILLQRLKSGIFLTLRIFKPAIVIEKIQIIPIPFNNIDDKIT